MSEEQSEDNDYDIDENNNDDNHTTPIQRK